MSTFQAVIYSVINGISQFIPISASAHQILVPDLMDWPQFNGIFWGGLTLGSALALLIYFRHDWASMISCLLQVIIFRKKPMTLDERIPLFLMITTLPIGVTSYYFDEQISQFAWTPLNVSVILAGVGVPLWFFDSFSRKTKNIFDLKWIDASIIGIFQATAICPGWDPLTSVLLATAFLNYKREPALKYAYFSLTPILFAKSFLYLKGFNIHLSSPMNNISWLSFLIGFLISLLIGLLSIGGFMKHVQQKGLSRYIIYRWTLAFSVYIVHWIRNSTE